MNSEPALCTIPLILVGVMMSAGALSGQETSGVRSPRESETITLKAGGLCVRVPDSRQGMEGSSAPGPILGLWHGTDPTNRVEGWIGDSRVLSKHRVIRGIRTESIESGADAAAKITYDFERGAHYTVRIRCVAGRYFIDYEEEISGLTTGDDVRVEMVWDGFHPTHRVFPTASGHIRLPVLIPMDRPPEGSEPSADQPAWREDPTLEMGGKLISGAFRSRIGAYAAFHDVNSGRYLGCFSRNGWRRPPDDNLLPPFLAAPAIAFRFSDGILQWTLPLVTGRRFSGLSWGTDRAMPETTPLAPLSEEAGLHDPERAREWVLSYPDKAPRPPVLFPGGPLRHPGPELFQEITGANVYLRLIHGYNRSQVAMTPDDRRLVDAHVLRETYICAEELPAPLTGPVPADDVGESANRKCILPAAAFLFPAHPMAGEWLDQYETFIELTASLYTYRAQPDWNAQGGAWRDRRGEAVWDFLRSAVWGNFAAGQADGRNCFANMGMAQMADWLVGSLSAPVDGRRLLAPRGPGSPGIGDRLPFEAWMLAQGLRRYRPLTAEYLMWAASPASPPHNRPGYGWRTLHASDDPNRGTAPPLSSRAFAGAGVVLRAAVGTPAELSLHLNQSSGALAYYAAGKAYSSRVFDMETERDVTRAASLIPFEIQKNGTYVTIEPEGPAVSWCNLGVAQFAEWVPAPDGDSDACPEYRRRHVVLVGSDYFIVHDAVAPDTASRFTWAATRPGELPFIRSLRQPEGALLPASPPGTAIYRRDSSAGDSVIFVSHRHDLKIKPTSYGCRVEGARGVDLIFSGGEPLSVKSRRYRFRGVAGVLRQTRQGLTEMALWRGESIGDRHVTVATDRLGIGISLSYADPMECGGRYSAPERGGISLTFRQAIPPSATFFVDGSPLDGDLSDRTLTLSLPPGEHDWQLTAGHPRPAPPVVTRSICRKNGARLFLGTVPSAVIYRIELSSDNGRTWRFARDIPAGPPHEKEIACDLRDLTNGMKYHARVTAINPTQVGEPSAPYPLYVSAEPPPPPDGLRAVDASDRVRLAWGDVLGAEEYRVYRRLYGHGGTNGWQCIFKGRAYEFEDGGAGGIVPAVSPSERSNRNGPSTSAFEYAVTAVNDNGESPKSVRGHAVPAERPATD